MNKLTNVSYMDTGGNVMCYSALYNNKYWIFGNEDYLNAYTVDPLNTTDENGDEIDPNAYLIEDATDFPTWREVIDSIPDDMVLFFWDSRKALEEFTEGWQGSLDKKVNED